MSWPGRAVVLAAGRGSRLGGAAHGLPKPILPVAGFPILRQTLRRLARRGVREFVIVVGHGRKQVVSSVDEALSSIAQTRVTYVASEDYRTVNNVYSLWLAREHLDHDVYLLDGDIVFERALLEALVGPPDESLVAVVPYEPGMTGTVVQVDDEWVVSALVDVRDGKAPFTRAYKTVSLYVLRERFLQEHFVPVLGKFIAEGRVQEFYEGVLAEAIHRGRHRLRAVDCGQLRWAEIDDTTDWMAADYLCAADDERFALVVGGHGGFQRYGAVDHLVMTNVYFPPETMWNDLEREFRRVAADYPAGQAALAKLLAGTVDQFPDNLVVGNGASELIKILCGTIARGAIVPVPTFNEYEGALPRGQCVPFELGPPEFRLDVDAFFRAADRAGVEAAIVVSPNNPTSLMVPREELLQLCERLDRRGTLLIVDESFVDFCADPLVQSLADEIEAHRNLAIVKSLSMSCGIPGLRLGYLLTAHAELAGKIRAHLPIWNVNGVAEAFVRLLPRYRGALAESCRRTRRDCDELYALLAAIPGVEVLPPSANFCLTRLPEGTDGTQVGQRLLARYNLLVKPCSGKSMPEGHRYLRVKSRTPAENQRFAETLAKVLEGTAAFARPAASSPSAG